MDNFLSRVKRIHLVGIGGEGMTALALLLRDGGFSISGSDIKEGYNVSILRKYSFKVYIGHSGNNVFGAQLVCYSSAVKADNIEILTAQAAGIRVIRRAELLALLSVGSRNIVVSGSHGKTTTSALAAFVLSRLGYLPNVFIGAEALNFGKCAWKGEDLFVIEADESDGTFLAFNPWVSIITNIDCEHLDFYVNMDNLTGSFYQLARKSRLVTIGCGDDCNVRLILEKVRSISYGFTAHNFIRADNVRRGGNGFTLFDLTVGVIKFRNVMLPLLGRHNILNALAIIALCRAMGENVSNVLSALKDFKGTRRRFQFKEIVNGVSFVDDYAHHPHEIMATLEAAKSLSPGRLVVIFQPHRYSRVKILYEEFSKCFGLCDYLVVTDIYPAGEEKISGIDGRFLFRQIKNNFAHPVVYIKKEDLSKSIAGCFRENDLVVALGAGDINIIMDKVIAQVKTLSAQGVAA